MNKPRCPSCGCANTWKYGAVWNGDQRFKCSNPSCNKQFTAKTMYIWPGLKTRKDCVAAALAIREAGYTLKETASLLRSMFDYNKSYTRSSIAIHNWEKLLKPDYSRKYKRRGAALISLTLYELSIKTKGFPLERVYVAVYRDNITVLPELAVPRGEDPWVILKNAALGNHGFRTTLAES